MWFFRRKQKYSRKEDKPVTLDEILKGIDELSDEEKAKVKSKMDDLYKAEDEREIDKIEEEKAEDSETKDEKAEEKDEESEEIAKDVDEVEEEVETHEEKTEDNSGNTPLEQIIRKAVADEVKAAIASLTKPGKEETEPTPATEKDKKSLASIEAIYS